MSDRKFKFTQASVNKIPFSEKGQIVYWDAALPGFGIYAYPQSKSYFVQGRAGGKSVKVQIGRTNVLRLDDGPDPESPEKRVSGARTLAKKVLAELAQGINPTERHRQEVKKSLSLQECLDRYLETRRQLKPNTVTTYKKLVRLYLADWLSKPIGSITKDMVAKRYARIDEESGPAQANGTMRVLRAIYNFAKALVEDEIPENPVHRLSSTRQWKRLQPRSRIVKNSDLPKWYSAVRTLENETHRDFLLLLLFTGLRKQEAATLRWVDVDLAEKTMTIIDTKNHHPHTLPLSTFLEDLLSKRKTEGADESPYVFPGRGEKTGYISTPTRSIRRVESEAGVPFCLHDLRRTFVTIAESIDVNYASLKRLLNHSTTNDVTQSYLSISTERLREPMEKISRHLLRLVDPETALGKVVHFPGGSGLSNAAKRSKEHR